MLCCCNSCLLNNLFDSNRHVPPETTAMIINDSDDTIAIYFSCTYPDYDMPLQDNDDVWRIYPHDWRFYQYSVTRQEIFQRCDTLQVLFFYWRDDDLYDESDIIKRMTFTRVDLESRNWTVLYQ